MAVLVPADQKALRFESALAAVAEVDPDIADRATGALEVILAGTVNSPWQSVAWSASGLTQSGYPLELAFVSGRHELRYAADVIGPERPASDALAVGCFVLKALGAVVPARAALEPVLPELFRAPDLRYGVRIGGRHGAFGDRFKLYVEVPRSTSRQFAHGVLRPLTQDGLVGRLELGRLRMLGFDAVAGTVEAYFRTEVANAGEALNLLRRTALAERAGDLIAFVEATAERGGRSAFRQVTIGVSVAIDGEGRAIACALFRPARFLFSSDAAARRGLLELCADRGLDLPFYSELTRPLRAEQHTRHRWHGLLAWTVAGDGDPVLTVGLAPPGDADKAHPKGVSA
jgi:hypothetical protein